MCHNTFVSPIDKKHMVEVTSQQQLDELRTALQQAEPDRFKTLAQELHYADLADFYEDLTESERGVFAEFTGAKLFAEVVADIPDTLVEEAIEHFAPEEQHELLEELKDDDLADALQDVSEGAKNRYLSLLDPEDKKIMNALLKYGEETAGGRMTTQYGRVHRDMTVKQAIDSLRKIEEETESLARIFVVDDEGALLGKLKLRQLAFNKWGTPITEIMSAVTHTILASADQEEAMQMFVKYDMFSLPVVDEYDRLLGVITHDDAMEILEEESTEDIEKMAGVSGEQSEGTYLNTGVLEHFKRRFPWLLILALLAILSGYVMLQFHDLLSNVYILALYLPMIVAAGGNTGGQAATMVIRAMALGELEEGTSLRVAWKETRLGIILGSLLGLCIGGVTFALIPLLGGIVPPMPENISVGVFALTAAVSLMAQITTSTFTGAMLPIMARKANIDPAVVASPAITTIVDVSGLVIYFTVATLMLPM